MSARQLQLQQLQKQLQLAAAEKLEVERAAAAERQEVERAAAAEKLEAEQAATAKLSVIEERLRSTQQEASALQASHALACASNCACRHICLSVSATRSSSRMDAPL